MSNREQDTGVLIALARRGKITYVDLDNRKQLISYYDYPPISSERLHELYHLIKSRLHHAMMVAEKRRSGKTAPFGVTFLTTSELELGRIPQPTRRGASLAVSNRTA